MGSFSTGQGKPHSDVDILLIVPPQPGKTPEDITMEHRRLLMRYFMQHDIQGKRDDLHPQWHGRRIDVYFGYSVEDAETPTPVPLK